MPRRHALTVLTVTDFGHTEGGASRVARDSVRVLDQAGVDSRLFAGSGPLGPDWPAVPNQILGESELRLTRLYDAPRLARGIWNRRASQALTETLHELDPSTTVIHIHSWTKVLTSSIFHAALKQKFCVVATLHDFFSSCPTGSLYRFDTNSHCDLRPMSFDCVRCQCDYRNYGVKLYRVARQSMQGRVAGVPGRVTGFVFVSEFSRRILSRLLPRDVPGVVIESPLEGPADQHSPSSSRVYLGVGRLSPEKGFSDFAAACSRLDGTFRGRLVGDGPERVLIQATDPSMELAGWRRHDEVAEEYARARVLIFPSRWYETYGLVVDEAARHGIPSIVAEGTAPADRVRESASGLTFPAGNIDQLLSRMEQLGDDTEADRMGEAAYEAYADRYARSQRYADRLIEFFESMLRESNRP